MRFSALLLFFWAASTTAADCPAALPAKEAAVPTEAKAIALAKPALAKTFGAKHLEQYEPFRAELKNGLWHVLGYLPPNMVGGTPEAELCQATGKVIRVYHTQ